MNPKDNKACYDQIRKLVAQTTPDLIATVGDNVSGVTSRFLLKEWIDVMDSFQIPWAPVFGNHDSEIPMTTLNWQGDQLLKSEYCLFQKGPSNLYGCGNYAVILQKKGSLSTRFSCWITADIMNMKMVQSVKYTWGMNRLPGMNGM